MGASTSKPLAAPENSILLVDRFAGETAPGRVIGSAAAEGVLRKGVDAERVIGIDHGALRIEPLVKPGWGRSGIAYGPFRRENGLAFHTLMLNGHNLSRSTPLPDEFKMRMWRWALGSEVEKPWRRMLQWLRRGRKWHMWRRLRMWFRSGTGLFHMPALDENLAVGWFPTEAPAQPVREGSGLAMHSIVPEGGELWARVGANPAPTLRGLQGVPLYYTVILRERGAAYYASSPMNVPGVGLFPSMRLLAIDAFATDENLYAGIHQSVLGEIGFRVDTRVYGAQVVRIPELATWYGTAHGADSLTGEGPLAGSMAEIGGAWSGGEGELTRTERGVTGSAESNSAFLELDYPAGLVHMLIDSGAEPVDGVSILWRVRDERNFWCFEVGSGYGQLSLVEDGRWQRHPRITGRHLPPNTVSSVQIYDDGEALRIYVNGSMVYGATLRDTRLQDATRVGLRLASPRSQVAVRAFEVHPREVRLPGTVELAWPKIEYGARVIVTDEFEAATGDLAGHRTTQGNLTWSRDVGRGIFELTGGGAVKIKASAQQPCPGRTAYQIPWPNPDFADVQVTITPAGQRIGTREKGRAGLIFWQDADNYITFTAFVEDWPAMSIAAFFKVNGFEELFDAVWSNVGSRMHWGEPHDFRVAFDGRQFVASINNEPVLYRALADVYPDCPPFRITRAGLVANWEWGNDTGSVFRKFVGRDR